MPESYLRELQRLVGAASAHLGVVVSSNERHAYWIDGSLGVLSCQGVTDEDTVITGRICQLDTTVSVAIKVAIDYDRIENSSRSRCPLTIRFPDDDLIELDASPGVAEPAERDKTEAVIEHVLARWRVVNGSLDRTVFNRELYGVWGGLSEEDRQKLIGFPKVK